MITSKKTNLKEIIKPNIPLIATHINGGHSVLFYTEKRGILIRTDDDKGIGYESEWVSCYDSTVWKIENESITLKQIL